MFASPADMIAAIASAPGPAVRGIIRISGNRVADLLSHVLLPGNWQEEVARTRLPRRIFVQIPVAQGELHVPGHLFFWPTHRSFTGEVLAELHLIGSPPLLNEILEQVYLAGARPAERGEFTLRAFLSGRIDLVQAEAVLGVIDAGNTDELRTALSQLAGGISDRLSGLREELLLHLADLEAGLDFVEEDIEFVERDELLNRLNSSRSLIVSLLDQTTGRMQSHGRLKVVLAGLPNAGKSTLFNALIGQQAALVSSIAGTTRDYLSATITHAGGAFDLVDTAGWEVARDEIEATAAELRSDQLRRADLIVWCSAADQDETSSEADAELQESCRTRGDSLLIVQTKADKCEGSMSGSHSPPTLRVAAEQRIGLECLQEAIVQALSGTRTDTEMIGTTGARCSESLQHALQGVERAIESISVQAGDELIALELREVLEHLGRIVGRVYTDDILDRIFTRFCIGK